MKIKNNQNDVLTKFIPDIKDFNLGIVLISIYLIFEIGSFQGLYPFVNRLRLPYIVVSLTILYATYLLFTSKINFKSSTTKTYFIFCLFVIFYSLLTTKNDFAREDIIKVFIGFLSHYIVLTASIKKPSQLLLIINVWIASAAYSSLHGILQGGLIWGNRWLKDENHISLLVATAIPFAFLLFFIHKSKIMKVCYTICMFLYISVNVVAASRGGVLGMVIGGFLCWLLEKNKFRNLTIVALAVVLVLNYAPPQLFQEMETLNQGTEEATADDRIYLWKIGLDMFYESPIFGVGLVNYPYYFPQYEKQVRYTADVARVPHSTPIQWLVETGLFGFIIIFILQICLFKSWYYAYSKREYLVNSSDEGLLLYILAQSIGIGQIVFWFCACFLSLLPYPFYWILIPFSESCRHLLNEHVKDTNFS